MHCNAIIYNRQLLNPLLLFTNRVLTYLYGSAHTRDEGSVPTVEQWSATRINSINSHFLFMQNEAS